MEVSQAIWLSMFFTDALLISPKRFDEIILDFYQDAGIWIVIASCVAEYLLLLTYIGVAAYDFFKNRKMMKKMNVQRRTYEFLKFDESHRDVGNRLKKARSYPLNLEPQKIEVQAFLQLPRAEGAQVAPEGNSMKKIKVLNAGMTPSNPQLLKFDGDEIMTASKMTRMASMNQRPHHGKGE